LWSFASACSVSEIHSDIVSMAARGVDRLVQAVEVLPPLRKPLPRALEMLARGPV